MIKGNILEKRKTLAQITVRQTEIKGSTSTKQHREKKINVRGWRKTVLKNNSSTSAASSVPIRMKGLHLAPAES